MHPGTIIGPIVIGLSTGALARLIVPGKQDIGILMTIVAGLVGTFVGLFIGAEIGAGRVVAFILEVAVAALLVWAIASISARSGNRHGARV